MQTGLRTLSKLAVIGMYTKLLSTKQWGHVAISESKDNENLKLKKKKKKTEREK